MEKNNEQQELDLFTLLRGLLGFLYNILKQIVGFFGYLLRLAFRHYIFFFLFLFIAAAYSYYFTHGSRKVYRAELTLGLNEGYPELYSESISLLNRYLKNQDPCGLDKVLQMPQDERGKICAINGKVIDEFQDSILITLRINIAMIVNDPDAFPAIRKALVDYFNNNDYLKSLNAVRIASLKEREKHLENDIAAIDSLQKIEYFQKKNVAGVKLDEKLIFNTDKQMFYSDKQKLLDEKETVSKELAAKSEVVSLIKEFPPSTKPFVKLFDVLPQNVGIALLLFFVLFILWDNRKPIINYLREK